MALSFNFIHKGADMELVDALFGPFTPDDVTCFVGDEWDLSDCAVRAGLFSSKSQARKAGFVGSLPAGFHIGRESRKNPHRNFYTLGSEAI